MDYKYELHCHASEGSRCAKISASDLIDFYKQHGYSGICLTDHFYGSSAVPYDIDWKERVNFFFSSYEKALERGKQVGMKVFFGMEYSFSGNDCIFLNIKKDWLLRQDDIPTLSIKALIDRIHSCGGFVIHAHPFRQGEWIEGIRLFPNLCDAVEVYNGCTDPKDNERALWYAETYKKYIVAGSDTHSANQKTLLGIKVKKPLESVEDLITAIIYRKTKLVVDRLK